MNSSLRSFALPIVALALLVSAIVAGHQASALSPGQRAAILSGGCKGLKAGGVCSTVDLNFATGQYQGGSLGSLLSITRASQETVTWSDGHLSYVGNNTLAISNLGLQVWESRTNLLLQSQFAATWTATRSTLTANAVASPDLTTNAATLIEDSTATSTHLAVQSITKAASALAYTDCVYGAPNGRTRIALQLDDGAGNGVVAGFDLSGGQVGYGPTGIGTAFTSLSAKITQNANGFWRACLTATSNTATTLNATVLLDNGSGTGAQSTSYSGNGTSGANVFGAELEQASFASPYIPTTTGTATRAADNVSALSSLLNAAAGTVASVVIQANSLADANNSPHRFIAGNVNTSKISTASFTSFITQQGGVNLFATLGSGSMAGSPKIAVSWSAAGRSAVANNGTVATDTQVFASDASIFVGSSGGVNNYLDGDIQRLSLWNSRIADAALKGLTQ